MNDLSKARATTLEVGEESEAQRLDNFLLRRLKGVPKSHVYRVVRSGEVRVNSGRVKPDYRVKTGDKVSVVARPMRDGSPGGLFVSVTLPDGRTLTQRAPAPPPAQ